MVQLFDVAADGSLIMQSSASASLQTPLVVEHVVPANESVQEIDIVGAVVPPEK